MTDVAYALSIKQPWAALLVHGPKTIEVRRWPTARRGRVLIHAARISDPRPEVWARVPRDLIEEAQRVGGIVGAGTLTECRVYPDHRAFALDRDRHLNDPNWFREPELYGFVFTQLEALPFRSYPGWVRFFRVEATLPRRRKPPAMRE
jgi:hypothetical protein